MKKKIVVITMALSLLAAIMASMASVASLNATKRIPTFSFIRTANSKS